MEVALSPLELARRARRLYGNREAVVDAVLKSGTKFIKKLTCPFRGGANHLGERGNGCNKGSSDELFCVRRNRRSRNDWLWQRDMFNRLQRRHDLAGKEFH